MPAGFWFLHNGVHLWARFLPEEDGSLIARLDSLVKVRLKHPVPEAQFLGVIGRLNADVSPSAAEGQLRDLSSGAGAAVSVIPFEDILQENVRPAGFVLAGAVAVILLIACGNVVLLATRQRSGNELRAGLVYWLFFAGKSAVALSAPPAVWIVAAQISQWAPVGGIRGLVILPLTVWICLLVCCGAVGWSLVDQRSRCRVCLRRLRMPVTRGSWASVIIDRPGTEYICPFGHGRLYVPELEPASWTSYTDPLKELLAR